MTRNKNAKKAKTSTEAAIGHIPLRLDIQPRLFYHQNSDSLNARNGELWRVPDPSNHVQSQRLYKHPIERRYFKDLELIYKYWKCSAQDILPLGLRKTTPYSQAMLALLRRIACASRGDKKGTRDTLPCKEQAHDALLRTVEARLQREGHNNVEMVISVTPPSKLEHTSKQGVRTRTLEESVVLRRDGLTFEDAETVRAMLRLHMGAVRKARRMGINVTLGHQSLAAESVAKIKEESDLSDSDMAKIKEESDLSESDSVEYEDVETARTASRPEKKRKAKWNVRRRSDAPSNHEVAEKRVTHDEEEVDISENKGLLFKDMEAARVAQGSEIKPKSERDVWLASNAPLGSKEMVGKIKEEPLDSSDSDGGVELEGFYGEFLR